MLRPPDFEIAFVGGDDGVMKMISVTISRELVEKGFLIAKNHGAYARESGWHSVDSCADRR